MLGKDWTKKVTPDRGDRGRRAEWGKLVFARLARPSPRPQT